MVDFLQVIKRIKEFNNFSADKEIADLFKLSEQDFNNRKGRGTLLPLIFEWAINENVNLDWLFKGEDYRIVDILKLLRNDPEGTDAVFHFLEAKKNFDRASSAMKQYVGKKLEFWFEFPGGPDGKEDKGENDP